MGGDNSKLAYRNIVVQLTTKTQPVHANDEQFWNAFWTNPPVPVQDMFALIPGAEIRALREESPNNLTTLTYKAVERLSRIADAAFPTPHDQQIVLNCIRLLTRLLPYMFEDREWRTFFWSTLPTDSDNDTERENIPLAQSLLLALCDLLFCPEFTVHTMAKSGPDHPDEIQSIDSCEYIWQSGVGFAQSQAHNATHDSNRTEILRLLLTCFSEAMYMDREEADCSFSCNKWVTFFTSSHNRHALPLFASLLNTVCAYDPVGLGVPYNYLVFTDSREPLVGVALQVLCVVLEKDLQLNSPDHLCNRPFSDSSVAGTVTPNRSISQSGSGDVNLFVNYMSRIHRDEDFSFILSGFTRLLNNPLQPTYLPASTKKVQLHQELLVLFWRMCEINKKFMYYVLKSSQVLDIMVPILYHLNDARSDQARLGLVHVGVFILLLLSGERNFGVRLNKPYKHRVTFDVTMFTGTHADLLIIVFHHLIVSGHRRLQPLYDCLLTIIANVSPYLKSMSMVTTNKLIHLMEVFSQPAHLYANKTNYQLVYLLLEVFNNVVQYQFDGNSNLVYTLIRKRHVFYRLANLPTDQSSIEAALRKLTTSLATDSKASSRGSLSSTATVSGGSSDRTTEDVRSNKTPKPQPESTLQASLASVPGLRQMTDERLANSEITDPDDHDSVLISHSSPRRFRSLSDSAPAATADKIDTDTVCSTPPLCREDEKSSPLEIFSSANSTVLPSSAEFNFPTTLETRQTLLVPIKSPDAQQSTGLALRSGSNWSPTPDWINSWKARMPLQTVMRLLQVLVPQVEKICIDKGLTDESEIVKFLQNGTLVGLLPVPHPILIRKYQSNAGTSIWFRNYLWGVIYLRNVDPPIWYDTNVRLFEVQRV